MFAVHKHTLRRLSTVHYANSGLKPLCCFTDEEEAIRDLVRTFAKREIEPLVQEMDANRSIPRTVVDALFKNGLMGIEIPKQFGGVQSTFTGALLAVEEMARVDPSVSVLLDVHNTLVNTVFLRYGSDKVKEAFLPRLSTDTLGCFCLSEAGSGSDAFALKTTATLDNTINDVYVLNGEKMWITNSDHAGIFLVFATVDPSLGYKGITCFAVDRDTPGLSVGKKENKLGICASGTCTVTLSEVKVPKWQVVGKVGKGYKIAIEILNEGRIGIAAQMLGLAKGAFDKTMPYLFQRRQFDTPIGDFQAMQHQYADVALQIETAHLLTYNAARLKANNMPFVKEAAMAKLHASRVAELTSSRCIEWLGGVGFTRDFGVEKYYRDCKIGAIYEGTSNIQLQTIAKHISKDHH